MDAYPNQLEFRRPEQGEPSLLLLGLFGGLFYQLVGFVVLRMEELVSAPGRGRAWWFLVGNGVGRLDGRSESMLFQQCICRGVAWKCGDDEGRRTKERAFVIRRTCNERVCDEEHDGVWAGKFHSWSRLAMGSLFGRGWHDGWDEYGYGVLLSVGPSCGLDDTGEELLTVHDGYGSTPGDQKE